MPQEGVFDYLRENCQSGTIDEKSKGFLVW